MQGRSKNPTRDFSTIWRRTEAKGDTFRLRRITLCRMNSFGRIFRVHIFGESHGPCVGVTIDGCAPGMSLSAADFLPDLGRRQGGGGTGTTPRKEADVP